MAEYNTFAVIDCKRRKTAVITSSAKIANSWLKPGFRVDVWSNNALKCSIYTKNRADMRSYIEAEQLYHQQKQAKREHYKRLRENRVR